MNKEILFNEIYSFYYNIMTQLVRKASEGSLDMDSTEQIILNAQKDAFDLFDSKFLDEWRVFVDENFETPFEYPETRPLSNLELSWLKSALADPRIKLFDVDTTDLEAKLSKVEPLFTAFNFSTIGKYQDGDDFENPKYKQHFQAVLQAIKKGKCLDVEYCIKKGDIINTTVKPIRLEYSEREDKFRAICQDEKGKVNINLASVEKCSIVEDCALETRETLAKEKTLVVEVENVNNALERFLTDISHYHKKVKINDDESDTYIVEVNYSPDEEVELVALHLMPFLHYVKVLEPSEVVENIKNRLTRQRELL